MTINDHLKAKGKSSGIFYFKQFSVEDGRSTMKVGTDAVLLGAVVELEGVKTALDIGTGCGIIALMLAQRSDASIDAIDLDHESIIQAKENFRKSKWFSRLNIFHSSLQDFSENENKQYDLIVSNPPFFSKSLKSPSSKKNISRHNDSLSFIELACCAKKLMRPEASFWVILPVNESREFTEAAKNQGIFIHRTIKIFPKAGKCHARNIIQLKTSEAQVVDEMDISMRDENGSYSEAYKKLTGEFYLDF